MEDKPNEKEKFNPGLLIIAVIGCVIMLYGLRPLIMQENAFRKIEGEITASRSAGEGKHRISLRDFGGFTFSVTPSTRAILQENEIIGKEATIWLGRGMTGGRVGGRGVIIVRKMVVDNEVIIPFRQFISSILLLLFFALFFLALAVKEIKKIRGRGESVMYQIWPPLARIQCH